MKHSLLIISIFYTLTIQAQSHANSNSQLLYGNWIGIDMYQDENTYDGKTFYLPNKEFVKIEDEKIKIYFYPYSKSDEFSIQVDESRIRYEIGRKKVVTEYRFSSPSADTLVFTMHFINKTFIKMYSRVNASNEDVEVDYATFNELDRYGFNPSAVTHQFELDTFHMDQFQGFSSLDSLDFKPFQKIRFLNDRELSINNEEPISFTRGFKTIEFSHDGEEVSMKISRSEGTQSLSIIPTTQCHCDSLVIPYITVSWADRIRKDMKENAYKYRN